ncbi:MAG: EVE domain-containing protein [Bacteriovoracaceae bacterium]|nr:EVE domain-containing protein [Bacteriovoracaceae bacterium]
MRYWLGVVSKEHVLIGKMEGFAQVCHGKRAPLAQMKKDDWLIYYSPGNKMGKSDLQAFTAIGRVPDDHVFQFKMFENFIPYRRKINYKLAKEVSLLSIKSKLEFTQEKNWGYQLRRGLVELSKEDYKTIANAMEVKLEDE